MKKIALLLSVLMVFSMLSMITGFAATTDSVVMLVADKTNVNLGETVTITVKITEDSNGLGLAGQSRVFPQWNTSEWEYVSSETDSNTFQLANPATVAETLLADGKLIFTQPYKASSGDSVIPGEFIFGTFTLKALKTGTLSIGGECNSVVLNVDGGTNTSKVTVKTLQGTTVTVAEAGGSEEIFDVDVEAGYTKDAIAIFAKNVTDEAFAAGTYGVIFGGNKYAAGVNPDTACEAGKTFVVKFVGGAEKLASGAYKYQAYYNNGVDVTPEKVLNIQ